MVDLNWFPIRDKTPSFFFSQKEKEKIVQAIQVLEEETSAEIRVHVERRNLKMDVMAQARAAFETLGMTKTNHRNGVLIFLCSDSRDFAIVGDTLIHKELPEGFWEEVVSAMTEHFRAGRFSEGVVGAILKTGEKLKAYFPRHPDDLNELPDDISSRD